MPRHRETIQIPYKVPDVLFDTAEVKKLQAIGMQSLGAAMIDGFTLGDYWGYEHPLEYWREQAIDFFPLPQEDECRLIRPQVIGICFSIGGHKALDGVKDKVRYLPLYTFKGANMLELLQWYPLVRYLYPGVPIVLIGTQNDLRTAASASTSGNTQACHIQETYPRLSTPQEGEDMARNIHALGYVECSALYDKPSIEGATHALFWAGLRYVELTEAKNRKWGIGSILRWPY